MQGNLEDLGHAGHYVHGSLKPNWGSQPVESLRPKKTPPKLQKKVKELKERLQKMSTTDKQRDKETTSPEDNTLTTKANILQEILVT